MRLTRSLGVNLHPTSLPGGRLGPEAYSFVDWLAAAGARFWQVLPAQSARRVRLSVRVGVGIRVLGRAPRRPRRRGRAVGDRAASRSENAYWIGDWVAFAGGDALAEQVRFEREWAALRRYAAERGVALIGDLPIYVAEGSCDHLAHPELFLPGDFVAGAPPDDLNEIGQKWGNPLYDWEALARDGYRWWIERLRRMLALVDVVRVDHFRAFAGYWTVPSRPRLRATGTGRSAPERPSSGLRSASSGSSRSWSRTSA